VLAWCGLMLVSWQRSRPAERSGPWWRSPWLAAFCLSYLGALLTHVYAIFLALPFLLVEAVRLVHRRIDLPTCVALAIPPFFVLRIYLRMTANYLHGISSGGIHIHLYEAVQQFLLTLFGPCLVLLLLLIVLLSWRAPGNPVAGNAAGAQLTGDELLLALGLLLLPLIGVAIAKVTHGPFFDRYFLAASSAFAILLAQVVAAYGSRRMVPRVLLGSMLFLFVCDALIAAYCHLRHASLDIPSPGHLIFFSPDPAHPFSRYASIAENHSSLDILVDGHPDYLFFQYYASPDLRRRLYFTTSSPEDPFFQGYGILNRWANTRLAVTTLGAYLPHHNDFLLYEASREDCPACVQQILDAGFELRSVTHDEDGKMEHFSRPTQ